MKGMLLNAKENRIPLMLIYMDDKGSITQRIITIKEISEDYIKAYCHWRRQYRTFKMENVLSIGPVRRHRVGA